MWLLTLSLAQGKVPGAVIGGRFAKVFKPSEGAGDNCKVNKLLSELKKTGIVTAKKEEKIELVVEGHSRCSPRWSATRPLPRRPTWWSR